MLIGSRAEWPTSLVELARMRAAAAIMVECRRRFAAHPAGLLGEIAATETPLTEWRHYPEDEVYDPCSHAQYFYHRHPAAARAAGEHGHFHTFLRAPGIPAAFAPLVLPETAIAGAGHPPPQAAPLRHGTRDEVCHLVAITLDHRGEPFRLFTTNRWVTGETWYRAEDVVGMLDGFAISDTGPSAVLSRWIVAMITLFRPQIAALLRTRDETLMAWRRRRRSNVFEDTRLEILSCVDIDVDEQLALMERAQPQIGLAGFPPRSALPWMAEGWDQDHLG